MTLSDKVKAECKNESKYRSLFTNLIRKHAGVIKIGSNSVKGTGEMDNFEKESLLIQKAISSERDAIFAGVAVGLAAFVSFRYGPAYLVRRLGGEKKARALQEAEEASRKDSYGWIRRGFALSFESLFGIWAGVRGYTIVSKEMMASNKTGSDRSIFNDISKIPLVEGRSIVAETICDEWVHIAYHQVPKAFWKNVKYEQEQGGSALIDPRAWTAIADFAINCQKRSAYTQILLEKNGENESETYSVVPENKRDVIVIPSPGVPQNIQISEELYFESNSGNNASDFNITGQRANELVSHK